MSPRRLVIAIEVALVSVTLSGCALFDKQFLQQLQMIQARQIAQSRLVVLTAACLMALPICVMLGLLWARRTVSLRAWLVLLIVEGVLLGAFVAMRAYFYP